jgi:hypothetical protein
VNVKKGKSAVMFSNISEKGPGVISLAFLYKISGKKPL